MAVDNKFINMKKVLVFLWFVYFCTNGSAQDVQYFVDNFNVSETCTGTADTDDLYAFKTVEAIDDTCDFYILFNQHGYDTLKATIISDTSFKVYNQKFINIFDLTEKSFEGGGYLTQDSLYMDYFTGGSFGRFDCICKAKRIVTSFQLQSKDRTVIIASKPSRVFVNSEGGILKLFDASGKSVMSINVYLNDVIPLSKMDYGIYYYVFISNTGYRESNTFIITD